ncbi:hypothetical protein GF420_09205 [candidate division GN15 bacterium]|nr:hypothetical protein [candidate division GN15 bacterium]
MTRLDTGLTMLGLLLLVCFAGCSDDSSSLVQSSGDFDPAPVTEYFPLAPDYASMISVDHNDGGSETIFFEVGEKQTLYEYDAYPLYVWDNDNKRSTSYIVVTDSALFYLATGNATPQKLLSLPLTPGRSWDRTDIAELNRYVSDNDQAADDDLATGDEDDGSTFDDNLGLGGEDDEPADDDDGADNDYIATDLPSRSSFPNPNGTSMQVQTVERITLSDGTVYAGAVRVANQGSGGKVNYYWFVPGVGLARYVLGASQYSVYDGDVVGEVVGYGIGIK